ncbi:MAG: amidohydrolase family protein [Anaerolineae bacterium]|nr:amidohydrolase family protein [Anaerolineae bacterium]
MRKVLVFLGLVIASCSTSTPETPAATVLPAEPSTPPTFTPAAVELAEPVNLALEKDVIASNSLPDNPAAMAVDGYAGPEGDNWWSSGYGPEQWIEIDLGADSTITSLRMLTSQDPPGKVAHEIWGRGASGSYYLLDTLTAESRDNEWLSFTPAEPWEGIQFVKIVTVESPSWVAWREIEVMGTQEEVEKAEITPIPGEIADMIFFNGEIITMDEDMTVAEALAVRGELILAVGAESEVMALAGPETQMIDLQGAAVMPGIVDAHTHILNDAEGHLGLDLHQAQQLALENGITTLANLFVTPEFLEAMRALETAGDVRVRTSLYLIATNNCGELQGDWYKQHAPTRNFGEMLRIGGVKIFADGGSCGEPAVSQEWYYGYDLGDLWLTQEQMNAAVGEAHEAGYQVVVHAIGDRAVEQAQSAYSTILGGEANNLRHRIDHNTVLRPEMRAWYGETGVIPVVFGYRATCSLEGITPFYEQNAWNYRAMIDANPGLPIAWHGDDPWVGPINPFLELHNLVTRREFLEDGAVCEPPEWLAAGAVNVEEGLRMMTINSAFALFRDTEVGSLEPGKLADLLIISANPLDIDADAIREIEIWLTMVDGQSEYCAPGREAFCPQ